jgi:hypothetical protein
MFRTTLGTLPFVLALASSAHAGSAIQNLVQQLDATAPTALCLSKSDGCATENSASLKAMKFALDHGGVAAIASLTVNEEVAVAKAKGLRTITDRFQNAKVRKAGADAIAAQLAAYRDAFSAEKAADAITAAGSSVRESIDAFTAIEAEAKGVTTGRDTYLKGRQADFQAMRGKIVAAIAAIRPYAESDARLAASLNNVVADPRNLFENSCDYGGIFTDSAIDMTADFDFISRLTNARNLKVTCRDTTDHFMKIGTNSKIKYDAKTNTLNFNIGTVKGGGFNSKTYYSYGGWAQGYAIVKAAL